MKQLALFHAVAASFLTPWWYPKGGSFGTGKVSGQTINRGILPVTPPWRGNANSSDPSSCRMHCSWAPSPCRRPALGNDRAKCRVPALRAQVRLDTAETLTARRRVLLICARRATCGDSGQMLALRIRFAQEKRTYSASGHSIVVIHALGVGESRVRFPLARPKHRIVRCGVLFALSSAS